MGGVRAVLWGLPASVIVLQFEEGETRFTDLAGGKYDSMPAWPTGACLTSSLCPCASVCVCVSLLESAG